MKIQKCVKQLKGVLPEMRLQLLKASVSSSGYLYWQYQIEYPSRSNWSQKWGRATFRVSSLEYFLLNSSNTNGLGGQKRRTVRSYIWFVHIGCWAWPDVCLWFKSTSLNIQQNRYLEIHLTSFPPHHLHYRKIMGNVMAAWPHKIKRKSALTNDNVKYTHSMNQPFYSLNRDDWDECGLRLLFPCQIKT